MEDHFLLSDVEFEQQFENCSLDATVFSHEAHLRLAWIHIKKYGIEQAVKNICDQLIKFVHSLGQHEKFNKTLTIAATKAVHHFMKKSPSDSFYYFILQNPRLKYNFKELLALHYSTNIYNSEKAKKQFVEPDLLSFD